jgi:hypothetical protein
MMRMKSFRYILIVCLSFSFFSCNERAADNPAGNRQPKTYLWLFPDSTVGIGVSRQHLRWWGEDPDGVVQGYLFGFVAAKVSRAPDTLKYTWVTKNDTLMQFPLDTLFRNYTVFVRGVDNTFSGLPNQSIVRLSTNPYLDANGNGVFDVGDRALTDLVSAMDPVGALLTFPIRNTRPTISFAQNPNDPASPLRLPDSTYTVVSIGFKGADDDGDNTLSGYRIALNDTSSSSSWLTIPLRDTVVTLVVPRTRSDAAPPGNGVVVSVDVYGGKFLGRQLLGQVPGLRLNATNVIYVQAKDVAGEYSPAIRIPSGTQQWYVKRPRGRLLLVQDYTRNDAQAATTTYLSALATVPDTQVTKVDILNISVGVTAVDKRAGRLSTMVPPYVDPALINTFLLYEYVFLYTDEYPSIKVLQLAPFPFLQNGGKMLFSTFYTPDFADFNINSVLREFAPIDSVCSAVLPSSVPVPGARLIPANYVLFADSSIAGNIYPQLAFNSSPSSHIFYMREAYKRTDGRVIYRLQRHPQGTYKAIDPTGGADTLRPKVAVVDGQGKIVFFGLPLHLLDNRVQGNPSGLGAFFTKIFTQHFDQRHKVDRRRF